MGKTLKGRYVTNKAFGFVDLGNDHPEGARYAAVNLDTDNNGVVDAEEAKAVKRTLYRAALEAGAQPLKNEKGVIVGIDSCLNFSKGGVEAEDDRVYVFNKGEAIMLTTRYTDANGVEYTTDEEGLTRLTFDQLHWLEDNGFIS